MFEKPPVHERAKPLDEQWYKRFATFSTFEAFEEFRGDPKKREEQKNKFLAGEVTNPVLDEPVTDEGILRTYQDKVDGLLQLKKDVLAQETNETVKQAYRWRINEKVAEMRMVMAAKTGKTRRFERYNQFIYGKPQSDVFAYTIQELKRTCETAAASDNQEVQQAARDLLSTLPYVEPAATGFANPSDEIVEAAKNVTERELAELLRGLPIDETKQELEFSEIAEIFRAALSKLTGQPVEIDDGTKPLTGWKVVPDEKAKSVSVSQGKQSVNVPRSKKMGAAKIKGLVAHEIGTHVARRENGERSRLMLLGLGLDRYENIEEGVATMRQYIIEERSGRLAGLEGHLAISLAMGLDGKKRDFRETFEVLEKHFYLKQIMEGKKPAEAREASRNSAYDRCVRTYRGTDGQQRGVAFTKDIVYRQGNMAVWSLIGKNPNELQRFSIGKYDPTNSRHVWILSQLGITDQDLEQLES